MQPYWIFKAGNADLVKPESRSKKMMRQAEMVAEYKRTDKIAPFLIVVNDDLG
jgi:hypothetical protein